MQLFTIGIYKLNEDGSVMEKDGVKIPTYGKPLQYTSLQQLDLASVYHYSYPDFTVSDNTDIQNFARAWTGFKRQASRGNMENYGKSDEWNDKRVRS